MNILALLAIFFGLVTIGLYCVICVLFDRNEQLRRSIGTLPPPCPDLNSAALDLITECQLLETRNDWLEAQSDHCKDVVAASMAQSRIPRRDKTRMEVAETGRMP